MMPKKLMRDGNLDSKNIATVLSVRCLCAECGSELKATYRLDRLATIYIEPCEECTDDCIQESRRNRYIHEE
jgi:hypothetical protein